MRQELDVYFLELLTFQRFKFQLCSLLGVRPLLAGSTLVLLSLRMISVVWLDVICTRVSCKLNVEASRPHCTNVNVDAQQVLATVIKSNSCSQHVLRSHVCLYVFFI